VPGKYYKTPFLVSKKLLWEPKQASRFLPDETFSNEDVSKIKVSRIGVLVYILILVYL
jgi:hypothetical protein